MERKVLTLTPGEGTLNDQELGIHKISVHILYGVAILRTEDYFMTPTKVKFLGTISLLPIIWPK